MKAIRGAITLDKDCEESVRIAVKELLVEIIKKNGIGQSDIVCMMFSNTPDIRSMYPAKAAREAGYYMCALYSTAEPEIEGALPLCIRVMILVESDIKPSHVYLKNAANLRGDIVNKFTVAVDGPAGSGKSTVCKILAERLDVLYLDTGAMYRACALKCIRNNVSADDAEVLGKLMESIDISVKYRNGQQRTFLDGEDVSEKIRQPEISMAASDFAAKSCVREKMVALQRKIASEQSCVLDGRDIGTNVLPNADFKFYLTATPEVRARRRYNENVEKGYEQDYDKLLEQIKKRDEQDMKREFAPLKIADDAKVIETSHISIGEVVGLLERTIQEKI